MDLIPTHFLTPSPRPAQRLQLTARMRQALRILQMPLLELKGFLEEELVANPLLEAMERDFIPAGREREGDEEGPEKEVPSQQERSLYEHLLSQWKLLDLTDLQRRIGIAILEDLDGSGYLVSPLSSIAEDCSVEISQAEDTLTLVQGLDPAGVACRSLSECLLLQIERSRHKDDPLAELMKKIVTDHFHDLTMKKWQRMSQILKVSPDNIQAAVLVIRTLNPKPGRAFGSFVPRYIVPDVIFQRKRGGYEALCNKTELPALKISSVYKKLLRDPLTSRDVRQYLTEKLNSAMILLRALEKRESTLERMAKCLAQEQADFLRKGAAHLRPFQMERLARRLGVHKSTVSRAVAYKYAETPRGVFALKDFFSHPVGGNAVYSAGAIKDKIRLFIDKESERRPISDEKVAKLLKSQGICIARRTVAKYRQKLHILPSYLRKQ